MKRLILAFFLAAACACSAKTTNYQVIVLSDIPSSTNYNWAISGGSTTSCYGNSCSSNWNDPENGTAQASGATLQLLLPDRRIAIVECDMKPDMGRNIAIALAASMNSQTASTMYRDCRVPETGSVLTAIFKKNRVKLLMQDPSIRRHRTPPR